MRIVKKPLVDAFQNRIMNIHPALLPSFPGLHGQKQAVDYGVRISGCTVHFVDEGVDTGPIIIQAAVPVHPEDTEETLSERILRLEHKIFPEAIRLFAEGRLKVEGRKVKILNYNLPEISFSNPEIRQ
jgi:phosphoribosylglycinamide formyltransferase-1